MPFRSEEHLARRSERIEYLTEIAQELFASGGYEQDRILLRLGNIPAVVDGYFILNGAFKRWRIEDGHDTEFPKIAAITCLAIMGIEPFSPIYPEDVQTFSEARCNEMYALNCAAAILGFPVDIEEPGKRDFWYRLLDVISGAYAESLESYRVDRTMQIDRPLESYIRDLHVTDKASLNSLICIFELISGKFG